MNYNPTRRFVVEPERDGAGWNVTDSKTDALHETYRTKEQAFHRAEQLQSAFVEAEYDRIAMR